MKNLIKKIELLNNFIKLSGGTVKTMGEVTTPISLVNDMLDTVPDDVWTNPELKWLDPCAGVGTFFSVVVERLMKGLVLFEPDEELRYKHIVENMLYAGELQEKNINMYSYAFNHEDNYKLNIYSGSYLEEDFDKQLELWGVEKFDVIVMNPPYQKRKKGNKKSQTIWHHFVFRTMEHLIEGGYLVAVHPGGWRNVSGMFKETQILLKNKQMLYLELHNVSDGVKTFGASTSYDFYCLRNLDNI